MNCHKCGVSIKHATRVLGRDYAWSCLPCASGVHPSHLNNAGVALRVLGLLLLVALIGGLLWLKQVTT